MYQAHTVLHKKGKYEKSDLYFFLHHINENPCDENEKKGRISNQRVEYAQEVVKVNQTNPVNPTWTLADSMCN